MKTPSDEPTSTKPQKRYFFTPKEIENANAFLDALINVTPIEIEDQKFQGTRLRNILSAIKHTNRTDTLQKTEDLKNLLHLLYGHDSENLHPILKMFKTPPVGTKLDSLQDAVTAYEFEQMAKPSVVRNTSNISLTSSTATTANTQKPQHKIS